MQPWMWQMWVLAGLVFLLGTVLVGQVAGRGAEERRLARRVLWLEERLKRNRSRLGRAYQRNALLQERISLLREKRQQATRFVP